jgi:glycine reductase
VTHEALELAAFIVREVTETNGGGPAWSAGHLGIDLGAIEREASREPGLVEVRPSIVRPGDPVRIANVLDAIEPAVKVEEPEASFPGALGRLTRAGTGRTHRLEGLAVLSVCDLRSSGLEEARDLPDSLVDMAGPGAGLTPWSTTTNLVLEFGPGASAMEVDQAIRRASLRAARDLATTTLGTAPDRTDVLKRGGDGRLPRVAAILQVASEGPFLDTLLYGHATVGMAPTLLDPLELLDGALISGYYDWAGVRNPTYLYQRNTLVRELLAADGERLTFAGLVLAPSYLDSAFEKQRSAMLAAGLAKQLGADGVVCTTFGSGNSHTDTMLTVRECERMGIRAVAMLAETNGGLTDHVREADAIVSTGNEDELVPSWTPQAILGGSLSTEPGAPVPTVHYLGAVSEMGDLARTAVAA